jgi:hypothetical protein
MKWAYQVKYKIRTACFLTLLITVILLSNFSEHNSVRNLNHSVATVVDDRLMPATYLFKITNALYEKRMLHEHNAVGMAAEKMGEIRKHNQSIASYIEKYEATVLTQEEKKQWASFKQDLAGYNTAEQAWLDQLRGDRAPVAINNAQLGAAFNNIIADLNMLTSIQVGEGNNVRASSASIISNAQILSYLEFAAIIILSLFTLVLLSTSDKTLFQGRQQQSLN